MKEKLESLIILGNMEEAKDVFKEMNYVEARDVLLEIGYDRESITPYSFICSLLCEKESANLHYLASEILVNPLCFLAGAYNAALYHARRAAQLDPNDISIKEYLLLFYNIPDKLISKEEAIEIAREIVNKVPNNKAALDVLSNI
jgi:tetratricopeptide (TPR) repeat protein